MIAYYDNTGKIIGGCYADSPDTLSTITKVPDGCTAIYIDDTKYPDVWTNLGEYTIGSDGTPTYTPIPDSVKLAGAQQAKINQIRDSYNQALAGGFNTTINSTQYTFGWQSDDITHMNATQTAVGKGFLSFPILYVDVHGNPVSIPDQATLDLIEETATKFMMAQHQQALQLVSQVQQATTVDAVNAIQWSLATY